MKKSSIKQPFRFPISKQKEITIASLSISRKEELATLQKNISNLENQLNTLEAINATSVDVTGPIEAMKDCIRKEKIKVVSLENFFSSSSASTKNLTNINSKHPKKNLSRMGLPNHYPIVEDNDIYTLIFNFLSKSSPCSQTAQTLRKELQQHQLLRRPITFPWEEGKEEKNNMLFPITNVKSDHLRRILSTSLVLLSCAESNHVQSSSLLDSTLPDAVERMLVEAWVGGKSNMNDYKQNIKTTLVESLIQLRETTKEYNHTKRKYEEWEEDPLSVHRITIKRSSANESYGIRVSINLETKPRRCVLHAVDRITATSEGDEEESNGRKLLREMSAGGDRCTILRINGTKPINVNHATQLMTKNGRLSSVIEVQQEKYSDIEILRREQSGKYLREKFVDAKEKKAELERIIQDCRDSLSDSSIGSECTSASSSLNHTSIYSNQLGYITDPPTIPHGLLRRSLGRRNSGCGSSCGGQRGGGGGSSRLSVYGNSNCSGISPLFASLHLSRMKVNYEVDGHLSQPVYCVVHGKRGEYVITGADDHLVKIWASKSGRLMYTIRGHKNVITDIVISPDNTNVASASADKTIRISSFRNGETKNILQGHTQQINQVCYDELTGCLISCSDDGKLYSFLVVLFFFL
jgi:hypothetical protein